MRRTGPALLLCLLALAAPGSASAAVNGKIAFVRGADIYVMNPDGTAPARLVAGADPAWSPGGTKLAFTSNDDVYVINADGTGSRPLTDSPAADGEPAWSPDGRRIAFTSDRDGDQEIYVMNADGSGERNVTRSPVVRVSAAPDARTFGNDAMPAWSPDGSQIAFSSDRDLDDEIYVMNADGTAQRNVTRAPDADDEAPAFSPDGTRIAFQSSGRDGGDGIYVTGTAGGTALSLADADVGDQEPAFAPDGTRIAFSAPYGPDGDGIYAMTADGAGPALLAPGGTSPDWQRCTTCAAADTASGGAAGGTLVADGLGGGVPVLGGGLAALLRPRTGAKARRGRVAVAARVIAVPSGETLRVRALESARVRVTVRLLGLDAPAPRRCGAAAARRALSRAVLGRRVWLVVAAGARRDRAGRLPALVATATGRQLQVTQLRGGWARVARGGRGLTAGVKRAFLGAQRGARRARRGVWARCGGHF